MGTKIVLDAKYNNEKQKPNCCRITHILSSAIELPELTPCLKQDKKHTKENFRLTVFS